MKRKITGLLLLLITIVGVVFGITKVNAETYQGTIKEGAWIPGYWISKKNGSTISYHQARWLNNSEGEAIYCIQPYVGIVDGTTYTITNEDMQILAGLSQDQWQMVTRLAYYGYGYNENGYNHSDAKWYVATQMLIWRTVDPARANDMYFTNGLNGTRNDSVLVSEMNEVKALAESHAARPNLNVPSEAIIGNEFNVTDSNGVLNKFRVSNVTGGTASINNNTLYVNPTEVGDMKITLSREANMAHKTIYLYFATSSQNLMRRGDLDPININLNVKVLGGKVTINKEDKVTKEPQGEATLKGATYGIYDETGTLIDKITTGDDGKVTSGYLPKLGKFYLQEISPSEGYKLDNTKYDFEITKDSLEPSVTVKEEVIENHFNYVKVYASDETGIMTPEENVDFAVYNKNNELVMNLTTDKDGIIEFKLPYGTYTLRQMTSPKTHKKMDDLTLTVKEADVKINKVISNGEYKAKLRVVKIDKETKEVIKRAGIKFKILDTKTNEYVCQTTSYPKATICEFETDDEGEFATAYPLMTGTYKLEEIDQVVEGYLWNSQSHEFTIDENSKLRTDSDYGIIFDTDFENFPVKGEVNIIKTGEVAILTEDGFEFKSQSLEGFKFGGWYKENSYVNKVEKNTPFENENLTLYPLWLRPTTLNQSFSSLLGSYSSSSFANKGIIKIKNSPTINEETKEKAIIISTYDSEYPVYAWNEDSTLYYYTEAEKIYLNNDNYSFSSLSNIIELDLSKIDTSKVTNMSGMFAYSNMLTSIDITKFDTSNVTNMSRMFQGLYLIENLDVSNMDTSKVEDMSFMFGGMTSLKSLDVSHFNTSKVANMSSMFQSLEKIENLDISNFDTSNVSNLSYMFNWMKKLKSLNISHFNTSKVTNMAGLFAGLYEINSLDLTNLNTSNVTDMSGMFQYSNLKELNLNSFNTSNVINMSYMFASCEKLEKINLSSFNTKNVIKMTEMFAFCSNLKELDVSNFNTENLVDSGYMFGYIYNDTLKRIKVFETNKEIALPYKFYDKAGNEYNSIDSTLKKGEVLTRKQEITFNYYCPTTGKDESIKKYYFYETKKEDMDIPTIECDHYKHVGWSIYGEEAEIEDVLEDKTYNAKLIYIQDKYNVTFFDGEKFIKEDSYPNGSNASTIIKPTITKENYTLVGWYKDRNLTKKFDFNGIIEENITLYAKWKRTGKQLEANVSSIHFGEVKDNYEKDITKKIIITNKTDHSITVTLKNPSNPLFTSVFPNNKVLESNEEFEVTLKVQKENILNHENGEFKDNYMFVYQEEEEEYQLSIPASITILDGKLHIAYKTHVQSYGWQDYKLDGVMSGTSGEAKRLEAIKIKLENQPYTGNVLYRTHIQSYGWEKNFKKNDEMSGTSGEAKRLEAIEIKLDGEMKEHYDVYYRVHAQTFGWLGWARNGESAGTAAYAKRLEGIEIKLVEKGQSVEGYGSIDAFKDANAPESITLNKTNISVEAGDTVQLIASILPETATDKTVTWTSSKEDTATVDKNGKVTAKSEGVAVITATTINGKKAECTINVLPPIPGVAYKTHVQTYGWQDYVSNGAMSGTSGEAKRLEGINIKLKNQPYEGDILYRTHIQTYGWEKEFKKNDEMSGTSGEAKRLEAIEIKLTGEMAEHYDIYYRVHAQSFGWLGWAKNGEQSGTAGYAKRLEEIEIVLVEKGGTPPKRDNQNDKRAFIQA